MRRADSLDQQTIPVGMYAAIRVATTAEDETTRRSATLFALPMTRTRLAITEIAVTAAGALILVATAGVALWCATALTGVPLTLDETLGGALNAAPVAILSLGTAVLALGWAPRAVAAIGAVPTTGGFLLYVITTSIHAPEWTTQISPYAHLTAVPDTPPNWPATLTLTTVAVALTGIGLAGYTRRDLNC